MLLKFSFSNYKSFKEKVTLDLTATKISEHSDRIVNMGNNKILTLAAIYGPNASGKSNVHDAFEFMSFYVINSFEFGGDSETKNKKKHHPLVRPFMFDKKSQAENTTFEVFFIDKASQKTFHYGFSLNGPNIIEEWLSCKTKSSRKEFKPVFYRNNDKIRFDGIPKKYSDNLIVALEKETLLVSLGAKLKVAKLKFVRDWFYDNEVIDFSNEIESLFRANTLPDNFVDDPKIQNQVINFFNSFDKSIVGFEIKKLPFEGDDDDSEKYIINAKHKIVNSKGFATIPLQDESKGTLEMFSLYPFMQEALKNGSLIFVDELNTKLHPMLVRNIILTFATPELNPNQAQLIFTTHDYWQLADNLLRRDEIWFTEKDDNGISRLYSLAGLYNEQGVKIRKDENYEKNYFLGKYGAIPNLTKIDLMED